MNILVCVKRVPATGSKIVLTADSQDIDTRYLGFTISPHEECAVEEAVRLIEAQGGSSTVLTLGPEAAMEQLRDAMALGIDTGILLETDGRDWDAGATAKAIVATIQQKEAQGQPFDLILFGNESADSGGFQVGIRVAHALDRPIVTGLKELKIEGSVVRAGREASGGREIYNFSLPAVVSVKEGLNLPRYPSLPGRLKAKKKPLERIPLSWPGSTLEKLRLKLPSEAAHQVEVLGHGPAAAARAVEVWDPRDFGAMILGLVEHDRGKLNPLSLEMLTFARRLAAQLDQPLEAVLIEPGAGPLAAGLAAYGVTTVHLAAHPQLTDYAPEAWAASVHQLLTGRQPSILLAGGSERGNEVLAHLAARADLPLAANVLEAQPGEPFVVTRLRWGGSLLEEARLHGATKLLTIAPHALVAESVADAGALTIQPFTPALTAKDLRVQVTSRIEATPGKMSLAEAPVVVGGGRGVGSSDGFKILEELAGLLGGTVGCSRAVTSLGWRPHLDQVGQTGTRIAPEIYIACGISGAIQHMVGCKAAKHILAINTDPDAPIVQHADYAIIGDLKEVVPAISACLREASARA